MGNVALVHSMALRINMKGKLSLVVLVALSVFSVFGVRAQQISPQTEKEKLIFQFRTLTGANNVKLGITVTLDSVKDDLIAIVDSDSELSAPQKTDLRANAMEAYDRVGKHLKEFLNDQSLVTSTSEAAVHQVYDQAFTEPELRELVAFYGSPTGKKALEFLPMVSSKVQAAFQTMFVPKVQEFLKPKILGETDLLKQKVQEAKTKKP